MKRLKKLLFVSLWGMTILFACSQQEGAEVNPTDRVEPALIEATDLVATERASPVPSGDATPDGPEGSPTVLRATPLATIDRSLRLTPGTLPPGAERVPVTTPEPIVEPVPDEILNKLLADVQSQTGIDTLGTDDYNIIRSEAIIWPDGSLGCPQPGVVYTQAPVEGYWIVIEAVGKTWDYRATQSGTLILCEQELKP